MASFKKDGDVWRVQIARKGIRLSGTFSTKRAAEAWATEKETQILKGTYRGAGSRTVGDLFTEYGRRVSDKKPGARWENTRIAAFKKHFPELAAKPLNEVTSHDFGLWRDARLKGSETQQKVGAGTVIREINLFSHAFTTARDEWKWIAESPLSGVRRPKEPKPRDRRISEDELKRLMHALGYAPGEPPETISARIALIVQFAIETGARASEICGLTWERVHDRHFHLDKTKNGFARDVPMSTRAREIVEDAGKVTKGKPTVFEVSPQSLDALFRKAKNNCKIANLHFHDTRHEACTRLARKLDVLDLARMLGIRDLKILSVYYNETAHDMAARLD
jgi:integrase